MIAKTRVEIPFKVSTKCFAKNYCFQKSGWHLLPGNPLDNWAHGFHMEAFCGSFNVMPYYTEDVMVL